MVVLQTLTGDMQILDGERGGRTESTFKHIEELCRYRKKCDAASTEGICRYWVQIYTDRDVQTLIIASTRKRIMKSFGGVQTDTVRRFAVSNTENG